MRGHTVRCLMASLLLAISLAGAIPAVAQDSDGPLSGAETDWIGEPPPEDCTVDPITVDEFVDALEADDSDSSDTTQLPIQIASEDELPEGEPADDEIVEGISATLWQSTACLNGGDFARFLALLSPAGVKFLFLSILEALGRPPGPLTEQEIADFEVNVAETLAAEPEALPPDERSSIDVIRDARLLPDDQVLVVVEGTIGEDGTAFAVLKLDDERWLIDAIGVIGELPGLSL